MHIILESSYFVMHMFYGKNYVFPWSFKEDLGEIWLIQGQNAEFLRKTMFIKHSIFPLKTTEFFRIFKLSVIKINPIKAKRQ